MRLIQVVFLACVWIGGLAGLAGGATVTFAPTAAGYGSQTRAIHFAFTDTDIGTPSIASRAIYGEVQRIVIEATGTDTNWEVSLTDAHGVTLFTKTDLTSADVPYSYAMGFSSVDGKSVAGIPTHGPLTVEVNEVSYDAEVQTLTSDNAIDGTYTLTYAGATTAAIPYDANLAEIQTALEALPNVDANDIIPSGVDLANTGNTVFTFAAALGDVDPLVIDRTALGKTAEVQTLTSANATAGTFALAYDGLPTAPIAYDANLAEIKAALETLPNVDVNDITVGGTTLAATGTTTFTFRAGLGDVPTLAIDIEALTGPETATFAETVKGAVVAGSFAETTKGGADLPTVDVTVYFKGDY